MKNRLNIIAIVLFTFLLSLFSCQNKKKDNAFIKKVQLSEETIAVGIYKPTGIELNNVQYIAEAINIDAGIVYVTLTDADILKTKLENIDVIIFPGLKNSESIDIMDDEIEDIFKNFITKKGKGALGFCNGAQILTNSEENSSLELIDVKIVKNDKKFNGLLKLNLTEKGLDLFPELRDKEEMFIKYNSDVTFDIQNNSDVEANVIVNRLVDDTNIPIFISSKCGKGKLFLITAHPETTPGMRWMIPRIIRWLYGKDPVWYDKNIVRTDLFNQQIEFNDEFIAQVDKLKEILKSGDKNEKLDAMAQMQNFYPWMAAEEVKKLLDEKNNDVKIKAAKYLVDIEYTFAYEDLLKTIKNERSKKVREKLKVYKEAFEQMMEQN